MRQTGPAGRPTERGQAIAEFAIVLVVLMLIVSAIIDFGRLFNAWIVVSSSAREGARQASIGQPVGAVTTAARGFALVPGLDPATVSVEVAYSHTPPVAGDAVRVRVTASQFEIVTPLVRDVFGCGPEADCYVPVSSETTMRYEGNYVQ